MAPAAYVGIDLAWGSRNRTGLAVCDHSGRLVASGIARTDEQIDAWLEEYAARPVVIAIDAPLVVPNLTGQRPCENEMARHFGRFKASAHVANRSRPWFDPPRGEVLAARHGWSLDPSLAPSPEQPLALEVYPHAGMVGLFDLPERVLYKKGPDRPGGFARLVTLFETIPELALGKSERWRELAAIVSAPGRGDLTRIEDELDAVFCAHLAWLWVHRPGVLRTYGSIDTGCIVAPRPPPPRGRQD